MKQIRLGTIGSGVIVRSILNNVKRVDGIELEAVYSRSAEKAGKLASEYSCSKTYSDLHAFLADPEINAVYVAVPNLLHYDLARTALMAGKNVICEKPFTTKAAHAEELIRIAEDKGLYLVEAAPTRYLPNFAILQSQLENIGRIRLVNSNYSQYSSRYDALLRGEKPAIFDPQFGGGCLMDINFYNVLLNILLFGKPGSVRYQASIYPDMADTSGVLVMNYEGFISTNIGAKDSGGISFFQIQGERGFIYIENGSNGISSVRVVTHDSDITYNDQPDPDRWFYEIRALTRMMLNGDRTGMRAALNTTLATIQTIESARKEAGILFPYDDR